MRLHTVSIVIPTRDGAETLPEVLDAIARQRTRYETEVVVIDSGSTDGTLDLVRDRVDRLLHVPAEMFDHGLTRNQGISASQGDLLVLLVQDAVPVGDQWLEALTAPFRRDQLISGTFARQRARTEASGPTQLQLERWVASRTTPRTVELSPAAFDELSPAERLDHCAFDNVCSCVRRRTWDRHPFPSVDIAEDLHWAKSVLLDGWRLAFVPGAEVVHSHERSLRHELDRTRRVHRELGRLFGLRTVPSRLQFLRAVVATGRDHHRSLGRAPRSIGATIRAYLLAIVWPLGQYQGGREATIETKARE